MTTTKHDQSGQDHSRGDAGEASSGISGHSPAAAAVCLSIGATIVLVAILG